MKLIGFTGTRHPLTPQQDAALYGVLSRLMGKGFEGLRHGDCVNADARADAHAKALGFYRVIHPPLGNALRAFCDGDEVLPCKDYIPRNHDIVDGSGILVACPDGPERIRSGTWSTVRYARSKGLPILIIWRDGTITAEKGSSSGIPES